MSLPRDMPLSVIMPHLDVSEHLVDSGILLLVVDLAGEASLPRPDLVPQAKVGEEETSGQELILHHVSESILPPVQPSESDSGDSGSRDYSSEPALGVVLSKLLSIAEECNVILDFLAFLSWQSLAVVLLELNQLVEVVQTSASLHPESIADISGISACAPKHFL